MKLCLIGSRGHVGYALADLPGLGHVRVEGICAGTADDGVEKLADWCAANGHTPGVHDDYREMLDSVCPDMVVVDGPFERHAEMCVECFVRGIHVFCEKPVAIELDDLARVQRAYAASSVQFAGMMGLRYEPAFYSAWLAVRDGRIGEVRMVNTRKSYRLGTRPEFYHHRSSYGGTIPWVGSHAIDWILWFAGKSCLSVNSVHSCNANRGHGDMEMTAMCQMVLDGDVFGSVSMDFLRPSNAPTHGDDRVRVAGSNGVIEVRDGRVFLIEEGAGGEVEIPAVCDRRVFADFVGQVEGKGAGLISAEETIELTRICLLARQSADEGRVVSCVSSKAEEGSQNV